jgi:hypothetical protein
MKKNNTEEVVVGYKIISSEGGYDEKGNYVLKEIMVEWNEDTSN